MFNSTQILRIIFHYESSSSGTESLRLATNPELYLGLMVAMVVGCFVLGALASMVP